MLRRASTALFCAFALVAPAYGQEIFVPRELKAIPVHPPQPKEVVRRAEAVTDADSKLAKESAPSNETAKPKAPKPDTATVKTEKTAPKEKSPAVTDDASRKTAKAEAPKEKSDKPATPKDSPATKNVAKTEPAKEKKDKPATAKEKSDSDLPIIKVEKATVAKEQATKTVAKSETAKVEPAKEKTDKPAAVKEKSASETVAKTTPAKTEKAAPPKDDPSHKTVAKNDSVKVETITAKTEKPAVKDKPATVAASKSLNLDKSPLKEAPASKTPAKTEAAKPEVTVAKTEKPAAVKEKEKPALAPAKPPITKSEAMIARVEPAPPREGPVNPAKMLPVKSDQVFVPSQKDPPQIIPTGSLDMGFTKIADGFDFPVGKPEAEGYYKARGFRAGGHVGEDWDGVRGGDTDLRDPIYCAGDGIVVFARDVHLGWGNVIIVRHAYRDNGNVRYVDSLYGHLNSMLVSRGQRVSRGQQIATMGTAHGQYDAHLHFEIRKNLEIGMSRSKFGKDFSNYYDPTQFINSHRHLSGGGANYKVAMNTFTHDWTYHFDKNRDFGPRKRSTGESSAALHKAVTSR
jgi:murein DD-endopeptidase MepM/ murein hydrolase activator NlpD